MTSSTEISERGTVNVYDVNGTRGTTTELSATSVLQNIAYDRVSISGHEEASQFHVAGFTWSDAHDGTSMSFP